MAITIEEEHTGTKIVLVVNLAGEIVQEAIQMNITHATERLMDSSDNLIHATRLAQRSYLMRYLGRGRM